MTRSRVRGVGILAVCLTVAATAAVIPSIVQAVPLRFEVTLESSQEVSSSPVITQAIGMATLVLNDAQTALTIDLVHSVMNTTAVIIHRAAAGTNGPVALHMGNPGFTSHTVWHLSPTNVADLLAGNLYLNIHSIHYPGGEIRGQITDPAPVPELSTWLLMGTGLVGLALRLAQEEADSVSLKEYTVLHVVSFATCLAFSTPHTHGTSHQNIAISAAPVTPERCTFCHLSVPGEVQYV